MLHVAADDLEKGVSVGSHKDEYHIKFEGVGLTLPDGLQIMKGVSGEFLPRRTCAIMGPSGAGKWGIISLIWSVRSYYERIQARLLLSTLSLERPRRPKVLST